MNTNKLRIRRVIDDLLAAMKSGEVSPEGGELFHLAVDLTIAAFPEATQPRGIDSFSLLVGSVMGAAVQKFEDEAE